jgi:hypothetical protein
VNLVLDVADVLICGVILKNVTKKGTLSSLHLNMCFRGICVQMVGIDGSFSTEEYLVV